jgi:hypothetical protein
MAGKEVFEAEIRSAATAIEQSRWLGTDGLRVVTEAGTRVLEALLAYAEEWIGSVAGPLPNRGIVPTAGEPLGVIAYDGPRRPEGGGPVLIALTAQPGFIEYVTIDGAQVATPVPRDAGAVLHVIGEPERLLERLALSLKSLAEVASTLQSAARALQGTRK